MQNPHPRHQGADSMNAGLVDGDVDLKLMILKVSQVQSCCECERTGNYRFFMSVYVNISLDFDHV